MRKYLLAFVFASMVVFVNVPATSAAGPAPLDDNCHKSIALVVPTWYEYLTVGDNGNGDPCAILGPTDASGEFDWGRALPRIALAIVNILLRVAGLLAVGFTIYGGFKYILSQGEPEATKKAKGTIIAASVGLIIASFASIIVGFVGGVLWG